MDEMAVRILGRMIALGGLAATAVPIVSAASAAGGYHPVDATFLAFGVLLLVTAVLLLPIRTVAVAAADLEWTDVTDRPHQVRKGWIVPAGVLESGRVRYLGAAGDALPTDQAKKAAPERGVSTFRSVYRGKDNRASTSKAVALAWTYAIVFGLVTLLALKLMGDDAAWTKLTAGDSLRPEYLLLLGGPYAAAVIAKYAAVSGGAADTKTSSPQGEPSARTDLKSLVADDSGDTDLGDLQYVLFNLVALAFFLATLLASPRDAFPDLPDLLVGLALTSAATYTAKQAAVSAAGPQLTNLFPPQVPVNGTVDVFGQNLVSGESPYVTVGTQVVEQVSVLKTAGAGDHLRFRLPAGVAAGRTEVRVANPVTGATARTAAGADFLPLEVQ